MAVVIYGGTGFVGGRLVKRCVAHELVYSVSSKKIERYCNNKSSIIGPNEMKLELLSLKNVDLLFAAAARYNPERYRTMPLGVYQENLSCMLDFLDLAKAVGSEHLIFLSSTAVYGSLVNRCHSESDHLSEQSFSNSEYFYALSKLNQEQLIAGFCNKENILLTSMRLPSIYGPGSTLRLKNAHVIPSFIMKLMKTPEVLEALGTGQERRDFLFVDDLVRILQKCRDDRLFGTYNVSNGEFVSIQQLAGLIVAQLGLKTTITFSGTGSSDVKDRVVSLDRFNDAFEDVSFTPFKSGLAQTIDWYKLNHANNR